jgi:hypothetical protein
MGMLQYLQRVTAFSRLRHVCIPGRALAPVCFNHLAASNSTLLNLKRGTHQSRKSPRNARRYTPGGDKTLAALRRPRVNWDEMQRRIPLRSRSSLESRWYKSILPKEDRIEPVPRLQYRPFTKAEDRIITEFRTKGAGWADIDRSLTDRGRSTIRCRWATIQGIRPSQQKAKARRNVYTPEEDARLLRLREQGIKYRDIGKDLPVEQ